MKEENVVLGYTLDKYNKKYRNKSYQLLRYTKKEVENFDKQYSHYVSKNCKRYLLKGKKWALINDTYYEIPRPIRLAWFRNLNSGLKFLTSFVIAAVIASSIICPTLAFTVWNKGGIPFGPEPTPIKEWYEYDDWYNRTSNATTDNIGLECNITVNERVHKVRLIGIDHDEFVNDKGEVIGKAHTTWEFVNLISDKEGYSLAYQWNDTNASSGKNQNYPHSSIRKALCGSGNFATDVLCAQKGETNWSSTYKNKTILSMLPEGLQGVLKTVKKSVGTKSTYEVTSYTDKLFMLSAIELGYSNQYDKGYGKTYSYYEKATDTNRIKKQVNGSKVYTPDQDIKIPKDKGQTYSGSVLNYAGYNTKTDNTGGGYYWLRSPSSEDSNSALGCFDDGSSVCCDYVYLNAYGVAPAFCL